MSSNEGSMLVITKRTRRQVLEERCTLRSEQGIYKENKTLKEGIEYVIEILILSFLL
jgi:hypothetical protein